MTVQRAHDVARYLSAQGAAATQQPEDLLTAQRRDQAARAQRAFERLAAQAEQWTGQPVSLDPAPTLPTAGRLQLENLTIDIDRQVVRQDDHEIQLTAAERTCLVALAANPGRILTREALMYLVYGDDPAVEVRSRAVDVHLSHLRGKLGHPAFLTTIPGIGWVAKGARPSRTTDELDQVRRRRREQRRAWARASTSAPPPVAAPMPTRPISRRIGP